MRKALWTIATVLFMLALSLLLVKLVDGMVQIDDDVPVLLVFLAAVNGAAGTASVKLYRKRAARRKKTESRAEES